MPPIPYKTKEALWRKFEKEVDKFTDYLKTLSDSGRRTFLRTLRSDGVENTIRRMGPKSEVGQMLTLGLSLRRRSAEMVGKSSVRKTKG